MFDGVALSAARVDDPKPGQLLGEYRVDEVLAQGGMGKVFRGFHPVIGKQVAIKVVLPHLAGGRNATARMVEEARAVNAIGHPNIVDIFAFGSLPDGRPYIVMELPEGESLAALQERLGRLTPVQALTVLVQAMAALQAAHAVGVIHGLGQAAPAAGRRATLQLFALLGVICFLVGVWLAALVLRDPPAGASLAPPPAARAVATAPPKALAAVPAPPPVVPAPVREPEPEPARSPVRSWRCSELVSVGRIYDFVSVGSGRAFELIFSGEARVLVMAPQRPSGLRQHQKLREALLKCRGGPLVVTALYLEANPMWATNTDVVFVGGVRTWADQVRLVKDGGGDGGR